ncbi:hypothetical protein [Halorussus halobius]|uniref:hypothetical protein n=1 Tax=Halorussus halobius TaxID=1710537 RepID=UPI00143D2B68|nr:hypothetical protein [Halorussus halobius]
MRPGVSGICTVAGAFIADGWYQSGAWRQSRLTESEVDLDKTGVDAATDGD